MPDESEMLSFCLSTETLNSAIELIREKRTGPAMICGARVLRGPKGPRIRRRPQLFAGQG